MIYWLMAASIISALWFVLCTANAGWYGNDFKRRVKYKTFDKEQSARLIRLIERYRNGEFTIQFSRYNDNLIFSKWVPGNLPETYYSETMMYVNVGNTESTTYGYITSEPHHWENLEDDEMIKHYTLNNEAYNTLNNLVKELKEEPVISKRSFFGRRKNEEVHLS